MLILPDSHSLGDTFLDPIENLIKLKEENQKEIDKKKLPGQAMLENQDMATGAPMSYQELIRKLKHANPNLIIEDGGVPGAIAVRVMSVDEEGIPYKKYLSGFYKDVLTEYSFVTTDSRGLANRESRGWREVVKQLIKVGALPYKRAVEVFGDAEGQRSSRWHELLRDKK